MRLVLAAAALAAANPESSVHEQVRAALGAGESALQASRWRASSDAYERALALMRRRRAEALPVGDRVAATARRRRGDVAAAARRRRVSAVATAARRRRDFKVAAPKRPGVAMPVKRIPSAF